MMKTPNAGAKGYKWAVSNLDAVAGSQSETVTLPGGASGIPKMLKVGGAVSASVSLNYGNNQQVVAICNPNSPADLVDIPPQASGITQSVSVTVFAAAAGYVFISVAFE